MHELSIAESIVQLATEHAQAAGAKQVTNVTLQIGALSCVHEDALRFSFDLVTQDTLLAGAELIIQRIPVIVHCPTCDRDVELPGIQKFRCPVCDTPSADIRAGRELDILSIGIAAQTEALC